MTDPKHSVGIQTNGSVSLGSTGEELDTQEVAYELHRPFSKAELEEAIKSIDPDTAAVDWSYADVFDPYGMGKCLARQWGRAYYVRAPANDLWIAFVDLPEDLRDALWERFKHQLAFPAGLPDEK